MPVLVPLTLDRFVAIAFPMQYLTLMKTNNCRIIIAMSWILLLPLLIYDIVLLSVGTEVYNNRIGSLVKFNKNDIS